MNELLDEVETNSTVDILGITDHDDCRSFAAAMDWKARHPSSRVQPIWGTELTIFGFTKIRGVPISTTHAITGAILGVGTTRSVRSVRWIWGQRIVIAWILTLPCSAFIAAIMYLLIHYIIEPFTH